MDLVRDSYQNIMQLTDDAAYERQFALKQSIPLNGTVKGQSIISATQYVDTRRKYLEKFQKYASKFTTINRPEAVVAL